MSTKTKKKKEYRKVVRGTSTLPAYPRKLPENWEEDWLKKNFRLATRFRFGKDIDCWLAHEILGEGRDEEVFLCFLDGKWTVRLSDRVVQLINESFETRRDAIQFMRGIISANGYRC